MRFPSEQNILQFCLRSRLITETRLLAVKVTSTPACTPDPDATRSFTEDIKHTTHALYVLASLVLQYHSIIRSDGTNEISINRTSLAEQLSKFRFRLLMCCNSLSLKMADDLEEVNHVFEHNDEAIKCTQV